MILKNQVKKARREKIMGIVRKAGSEEYETEWDEKGIPVSKKKSEIKKGRLSRARGARFELKVREELESQGWIMDKWTNNVDLSQRDDSNEPSGEPLEGKLVKAKRKYNPFKKMLVVGTGFPDFIAFKKPVRRSAYTQPSRCRARAQDPKARNVGAKKKPEKAGFRHLITSVQLKKEKELNKESQARAKKVAKWIEKYAGEDMKFEVKTEISAELSEKEKEAMKELRKSLESRDFNEEKLFDEFYSICEKLEMKNKEFFDAAYRVIIGKNKGPRLASLILTIGKDKIIKLLEQVK
ncbi:MAG: hypothetical protein KJ721_02970 [Nanoarchaeota archaeon]|nr:hypothetical protein [Nanoarchaeota archaeon]